MPPIPNLDNYLYDHMTPRDWSPEAGSPLLYELSIVVVEGGGHCTA